MTTTYPQKITFGELRKSGVRDVLVIAATKSKNPASEAVRREREEHWKT